MKNILRVFAFALYLFAFSGGCTLNKAKVDNDLKKYFDARNIDGSFTMLDNGTGKITVYNMEMDTARAFPEGTFHIVSALIGLETGKITTEDMVIKQANGQALTMTQAFKLDSGSYFKEVDRRVGRDTMKLWVDSISYGNKNIEGPVDSSRLYNGLKISPDEQLGLVKRLYFEQLPFRKGAQQAVKAAMLREDNTAYKLSYTTGHGVDENNNAISWVVGWIEENSHVYFFTTLLRGKDGNYDGDMVRGNIAITKDILKHYGFFEGKK